MSEKKVPEVRFRGFCGEWETNRLENSLDVCNGQDYKHLSSGNIPVYGTGGYMLSVDKALSYTDDAVGIGRKGTIDKPYLLKAPFWTVDTLFYAIPKKQNDLYFLYCEMQKIDWKAKDESTGVPSLSKTTINSVAFTKPSYDEQTKIGEFFKNLDNLIAQNQKKYDRLVNMKKACLDKMFPKDGADIPEVRFKGFSGQWERCKFDKIVDQYEEPVQTPTDGYMRLGIRSHAKGTFHSYVEKGRELQTAKMHKVIAGNFIVNITFGWEHAVAITGEDDAGKLVSHRFPQFKFCDGMVPKFFKYVIIDTNFRHHLWLSSPGGAGRNRVLKINEMLEYEMNFPCKTEQIKIGTFFQTLDNLITLQKNKLEKLKNIKKALLDKMFI